MIRIKDGVCIQGLRPEMVLAVQILDGVFSKMDYELVITSAVDSNHGKNSLHFVGLALDIRNYHVQKPEWNELILKMKNALGNQFDVVLEKTHIHIEFQPETGVNL